MYTLMSNTAQVRISLYDIPNRPTIFYSSPMNWVCEKDILVGSRKLWIFKRQSTGRNVVGDRFISDRNLGVVSH